MFTFSAPGQSPPPLRRNTLQPPARRNTRGIVFDIRREVMTEVQTVVSDIRHMLKNQEGTDVQHLSVSVTRVPSATEYTFTVS